MKRKLVVFTLLAATVIGTLSMTNTSAYASAYTSYVERMAAANTGTETMSPDPTQVVFHTDKETKETIRNMFDPAFYAYSYPDVAHAYGITDAANLTDEQVNKLWLHFWNNGIWCGRACNAEFNASVYASAYSDLQVAYGSDIISYYLHYANTGKNENRTITTVSAAIDAGIPIYDPIHSFRKGVEGVASGAGVSNCALIDSAEVKAVMEAEKANTNVSVPKTDAADTPNTTVSTPSKSDSDSVSNDTAATPTEPSKPDTSTEPSEPSNPTVPTKPEQPETPSEPELIDGKYKGLCFAEGYKKLLASGMSEDEARSKMRIPDYKDTADYQKVNAHWMTLMPNQTTYLDASGYNEAFQEWKNAVANGKADESTKPNEEEYLAKTTYQKDFDDWCAKAPKISDFCPEWKEFE